jgi:hypothetical protein
LTTGDAVVFGVFGPFLKGVGRKWVSKTWFFDGESVVECGANVVFDGS